MNKIPHPCALSRTLRVGLKAVALSVIATSGFAADYYIDPAGSASNPGTSAAPWPSLQTVFATTSLKNQIQSGDVLHVRNGYHGFPVITGVHDPVNRVTIQPAAGATPKVRKLVVQHARGWVISGLDICPLNAGATSYDNVDQLVWIHDNSPTHPSSHITLKNSKIRSVFSIAGYTAANWYARTGKALQINAPYVSLIDNHIENTSHPITVTKRAHHAHVAGNFIKAFSYDAIRGLSNDSIYENNWVQDSYIDERDVNHDDFFQSWSQDGEPTERNILRNNVFISRTDPNQPLYSPPQGIFLGDGFHRDWVIENNVIFTQTYHGITIEGAYTCRIVNNTVLINPHPSSFNISPRILVDAEKDGSLGHGNIVRNNLATGTITITSSQGVASNNLQVPSANHAAWFVNFPAMDARLIATSPAVNAGTATNAPALDHDGNARVGAPDVGAYEYQPAFIYDGFDYITTTSVQTAPDSASDTGLLGTTWSGTNDIVAPGLTRSGQATMGNALKFSSNVNSNRLIDTTVLPSNYTVTGTDGVPRLGAAGTTLWFSFLIRADVADSAGTLVAGLNLNGSSTGGTVKLSIGDVGTATQWALKKGTTVGASTQSITVGATVRLVARIKFVAGTNNDEVDLFVNPASGVTAPTTPSATLRNLDIGAFNQVEFKGNRTSTADELAIGMDWSHL